MTSSHNRTEAREYAFKFLYHLQLKKLSEEKDFLTKALNDSEVWNNYIEEFNKSYYENDNEHPHNQMDSKTEEYALNLVRGILENYSQLSEKIEKKLQRDNLSKSTTVDQTILLLGTFELSYEKETPQKVIINEAINLAKKFGGENSHSFINGVLDGISKN